MHIHSLPHPSPTDLPSLFCPTGPVDPPSTPSTLGRPPLGLPPSLWTTRGYPLPYIKSQPTRAWVDGRTPG
ncbi:hypothetical protein FRC12_000367 [Ceratobasidium sp. 428]|nr:hypothetical protein FRC12_000367 [Ceratobasidium sp. 428]